MAIKTKFTNLDNLLLAIFGFSLVVPAIVEAYDFDTRLVWIPTLCYVFWILIMGYVTPNFLAEDSIERSTIERIRGWSYVILLPITLVYSSAVFLFLPETIDIMYRIMIGVSILALVVALIMNFLVNLVPNRLFRKETACMEITQKKLIHHMLSHTGSASIWASMCILILNSGLANMDNNPLEPLGVMGSLLLTFPMFIYVYYRNRQSYKIACKLAESLVYSKWHKKYTTKKCKKTKF